ncbi:hypothetical protein C8J56DRAFT_962513 [Mycena floridula]|nr:hypothetical protein C8J56DRAFT_962513 [Mycena floridula]
MSFWSNSLSKWAADVAASSLHQPERAAEDTDSFDLPSPVVQKPISRPSRWRRFQNYLRTPSTIIVTEHPMKDIEAPEQGKKNIGVKPEEAEENPDLVDVIVVDRSWTDQSEPTASDDDEQSSIPSVGLAPERSFAHDVHAVGTLPALRRRILPALNAFLNPRFASPAAEADYQRELWVTSKPLALFGAVFFISNWVLGVIFVQKPLVTADKIYYYGVAPVLSVPLLFMCAYDFPRDHATFYQCFLAISTWSWSFYQVLFLFLCNYYGSSDVRVFTCGTKDFLSTFYYTTALQTVALFGTNLKRLPAVIGAFGFLVFSSCLINKALWTRNILNFLAFQIFLLFMHYRRDMSERHLKVLRKNLELQFERTREAQLNERKTADSKHRLTSYVFHEVRVPLNTALLAVQNMGASGTIAKSLEVEFNALEGSLSMMSKVLNDVLDFNRMDNGRFESLARPYGFHQVIRSMFLPLRLATDARNLEFVTNLDMKIDDVARRAAFQALGESPEVIEKILQEQPSDETNLGWVVGDENRLMQIVYNLASNACKFTPAGGKLTISTKLILPETPSTNGSPDPTKYQRSLSASNLKEHEAQDSTGFFKDKIVVRIEVSDTGSGIRSQDMENQKLFSAFTQTEEGRRQGGKGTGLGLALVRLIVNLSRGRLGVKSKAGEGSNFWVEIPLGVGSAAILPVEEPITLGATGSAKRSPHRLSKNAESQKSAVATTEDMSADTSVIHGPKSVRSVSAMQGLMNQGGRVELSLARYDSHSSIPSRTVEMRATPSVLPPQPEPQNSSDTMRAVVESSQRPTHIPLPSFSVSEQSHCSSVQSSRILSPRSQSSSALFSSVEALVVDDDPLTRLMMKRLLERLGCRVTTAENGEIALGILLGPTPTPASDISEPILDQSESDCIPRFSIVFLDNHMPVLSGLQTVTKLRSLGRTEFVVGVTANALITDQHVGPF